MLLSYLDQPISVINLEDFGVNTEKFLAKTSEYYLDFDWDQYLFRQHQIEFLQQQLPQATQAIFNDRFWLDYYIGTATPKDLDLPLTQLSEEQLNNFLAIKPTQKRAISEFEMIYKDGWKLNRVAAQGFGQEHAMISDNEKIDYRVAKRFFPELAEEKVDEKLITILRLLADKITCEGKEVKALNAVIHHTQVFCYPEISSTNSPEGIHQDGMDYIVSALVVERNNIKGGKSIVYGNDKRTRILETELKPGQGILQPDRGSELWHTVTPITSKDGLESGARSTIGFDFTISRGLNA